jgi:hypothetical protein
MSFDFSTLILDSDRHDGSAAPSHGSVVLAEARRGHPSIEKARGSGTHHDDPSHETARSVEHEVDGHLARRRLDDGRDDCLSVLEIDVGRLERKTRATGWPLRQAAALLQEKSRLPNSSVLAQGRRRSAQAQAECIASVVSHCADHAEQTPFRVGLGLDLE